ncbi:phosphotransferase [Mycolicibacterium baixiangningiae]|uniref:phosphotransferase n=1 Tax=Mycolicibacterium baixiangningiae TaxID=2761578 RepID=UPI001868ADCC|nr:phosphotransferase [Mycolicibacterium baixiangningiae]
MTTVTEPPVAARLRALGLFSGTDITADPTPVMASPSWWGADSEGFDVRAGAQRVFVKAMASHVGAYVDITQAFAAATEAGERGVGPRVFAADAAASLLVQENFVEDAHTATLDVFDDDTRLAELIALRAQVRDFTAITRRATVFDDIRTLSALAAARSVPTPTDFAWMCRLLDMAEKRIMATGFDTVPAHGDGNVSNVLLPADGRMLLVDWDVAAVMDPLQDIGVLLAEVRPFDSEGRAAFEMAWGSFDQALFDRARVYGVADCVRWGLIGAYADTARPGTLEYSKFSDWQFVRARAWLTDVHFHDRLGNL